MAPAEVLPGHPERRLPTGSCCCSGVGGAVGAPGDRDCASSLGAPPMERWCLRRRRREGAPPPAPSACERCRSGVDYHRRTACASHDCDSNYVSQRKGESGVRLPSISLPADLFPHSSPLFLAAPRGAATCSPGSVGAADRAKPSDSGAGRCGRLTRGFWEGSVALPCILVWLTLGALLVGGASASIMGDGCDWSGSGLMAEAEVSREGGGVGVRPVYLRCSQGAVSWAYPRGALRVLLRLSGGGDFRGCARLGRTWKGARLFLEGVRSLHPLFAGEEGEPRAGVRCFQSRKGQAALYVEATPGGVSPRGRTVASFEYHLQPLPTGVKSFDPSEECRPCTMEEMTHAFCSSDLVTRGTIRSVETREDPETSELRVRVTKLIRRTRAPPPALEDDPLSEDDELQEDPAARAGRRRHWWDSGERGASVTLHVAAHCGAHHGAGEFVFMAQRKLGQLRLRCAPRLEDWAELARKSNRLAATPCVLQA